MAGKVFVVMGVSGCGKSSIGKALAQEFEGVFYDGDDFHSQKNIAKMSAGIALDDQDRQKWLESLAILAKKCEKEQKYTFIACSALKKKYRKILLALKVPITFLYLKGDKKLIAQRLQKRDLDEEHFMSTDLLESQFEVLEEPCTSEKNVVILNIDQSITSLIAQAKKAIAQPLND